MDRKLTVLYASQTGTAQDLAEEIWRDSKRFYFKGCVSSMEDYPVQNLIKEEIVIFVCSTTGQGEEPDNMKSFWKFLLRKSLPTDSLCSVKYAVLGLGDSSYVKFNFVAKKLNKRLAQLGGFCILPLGLADDQHDLGASAISVPWTKELWNKLLELYPLPVNIKPLASTPRPFRWNVTVLNKSEIEKQTDDQNISDLFHQNNNEHEKPFKAVVKENKRTTSLDHFQDVRLISFTSAPRVHELGDVLYVRPQNSQENIDELFKLFEENQMDLTPGTWVRVTEIDEGPQVAAAIGGVSGGTNTLDSQDDEYRYAGCEDPKIMITTSRDPSSRLKMFAKELRLLFPNAQRMNRGNYEMKQIIHACRANDVTDFIVVHEHRELPVPSHLNHPLPLAQLVRQVWDLSCPPRMRALRLLGVNCCPGVIKRENCENSDENAENIDGKEKKDCDESLEREKLLELSSPEGQQDFYDYVTRPRRSVLEVLRDFPHATGRLNLQILFEIFSVIKPRAFSIASAPLKLTRDRTDINNTTHNSQVVNKIREKNISEITKIYNKDITQKISKDSSSINQNNHGLNNKNICDKTQIDKYVYEKHGKQEENENLSVENWENSTLDILVAVVEYRTRLAAPRRGLCSNWLKGLKPGYEITAWYRKGTFKFPENEGTPLIMVGPGTGLAPFRSVLLWKEELSKRSQNNKIKIGENLMFFGCRGREKDFHCRNDLERLEKKGIVKLFCAFSRDQEEKIYVQHLIALNKELISGLLLENGAHIFVAGNSKNMPESVREAFDDIIGREICENLVKTGRYQEETWS